MSKYKDAFLAELDKRNIKYTNLDDVAVRIDVTGRNLKVIPVVVIFDRPMDKGPGNMVQIDVRGIVSVPPAKRSAALDVCNALNRKLRVVKFVLHDRNDVCCQCDEILDPETAGAAAFSAMARVIRAVDANYSMIAALKG